MAEHIPCGKKRSHIKEQKYTLIYFENQSKLYYNEKI